AAASVNPAPSTTASNPAATAASSNHGLLPTRPSHHRSCRAHRLRPRRDFAEITTITVHETLQASAGGASGLGQPDSSLHAPSSSRLSNGRRAYGRKIDQHIEQESPKTAVSARGGHP